jgi:hypothetical protein
MMTKELTGARLKEWYGESAVLVLRRALRDLLNYTGGWDVSDPDHPIVRARNALGEDGSGEQRRYVEIWLTPVEARRVLDLLDADHENNPRADPVSKSAAKKVWRRLLDLGLIPEGGRNVS